MKKVVRKEGCGIWSNLIYLMKGIWDSDKKLMALIILETLCMVITPYAAMYLPKMGVDLVMEGADARKVILILGWMTAVIMAGGRGERFWPMSIAIMRMWKVPDGRTNIMRRN